MEEATTEWSDMKALYFNINTARFIAAKSLEIVPGDRAF
jgi:hypothetical protein